MARRFREHVAAFAGTLTIAGSSFAGIPDVAMPMEISVDQNVDSSGYQPGQYLVEPMADEPADSTVSDTVTTPDDDTTDIAIDIPLFERTTRPARRFVPSGTKCHHPQHGRIGGPFAEKRRKLENSDPVDRRNPAHQISRNNIRQNIKRELSKVEHRAPFDPAMTKPILVLSRSLDKYSEYSFLGITMYQHNGTFCSEFLDGNPDITFGPNGAVSCGYDEEFHDWLRSRSSADDIDGLSETEDDALTSTEQVAELFSDFSSDESRFLLTRIEREAHVFDRTAEPTDEDFTVRDIEDNSTS